MSLEEHERERQMAWKRDIEKKLSIARDIMLADTNYNAVKTYSVGLSMMYSVLRILCVTLIIAKASKL